MRLLALSISIFVVLLHIHPAAAQLQGQWTATGSMQSAREAGAQLTLAGGALAVGGVDNSGNILAAAELYSARTGLWTATGSLQTARETFAAVLLTSGKVLVAGGLGTGGTVLASAELYDPATGAWTPAGALSVPRFGHTATLLKNGKVLVTGGCTVAGCGALTGVSELYDPVANAWSTSGSLNTARTNHSAVRLKSGQVLVIDGYGAGVLSSCELYNPATGTWSNAASTNSARELHATTMLRDGKVLVTGGVVSKYPMSSAELYDPAGNTWTATGGMTVGRYGHTSVLLSDGTVLVAGGEGQSISCGKDCAAYIPTASAEIFTEAANGFAATTPLNRALAYHSASVLSTGRALTAGGEGYNVYCCQVVADAEIYTPLTLTFSASSLSFGVLQIGLTSPMQTITVSNRSAHPSAFTLIAASGDYAETNTCPASLGPGQSCAIAVTFAPTAAGLRAGAVTLRDNDPGSPVQSIALAGTGEPTTLGLVPDSLNFGSVLVGSAVSLSATLVNDGAAPVTLTAIGLKPTGKTYTQTNDCPTTLNVQQSCTFNISFAPPDVFTYKSVLSVTSTGGGAASVQSSGTGIGNGG
jgi:N-acetylneuraminic acid mutarotase